MALRCRIRLIFGVLHFAAVRLFRAGADEDTHLRHVLSDFGIVVVARRVLIGAFLTVAAVHERDLGRDVVLVIAVLMEGAGAGEDRRDAQHCDGREEPGSSRTLRDAAHEKQRDDRRENEEPAPGELHVGELRCVPP